MIDRLKNILRQPEESDVYLCIGVESLFFGAYCIYPPASYILVGLIFVGLAYLAAPKGAAHGMA